MSNWSKIFSIMLVAGSMAFAQYDDDEYDSDSESTEQYSYGADDSAEETKVGNVKALSSEWDGFSFEDIGITQWEFQQIKEAGVSRDKLTHLVEIGIRPTEYLQKPWEKMGVAESEWIAQRSEGMEDADIDRSYRNNHGEQGYAYISLIIPSVYQWHKDQVIKATAIDAVWAIGVGATVYLKVDGQSNWFYMLIPVVAAHIYSFADAFFGTQWDSNPDANRFSFGVAPTPEKGVAGMLQMKF